MSSEYARRLHSIRNLAGLQVLRSNGIYKLTDFTLVDGFVHKELKELYFSRCNVSQTETFVDLKFIVSLLQFTLKGVRALVENCPSLEILDLSENKEIDDECVDIITSHLPRLKTLKLNRCSKITERIFDILYKNCTDIRVRSDARLEANSIKHFIIPEHLSPQL